MQSGNGEASAYSLIPDVQNPQSTLTSIILSSPIPIRFFLMGLIQVIFDRGLATPGRMEGHITGWQSMKEIAATFDLDAIARVTGISSSTIERIAEEFASADSAICYGRTGVSMVQFAGLSQWLMYVLNIITGNMDEKGGMMFPVPALDSLDLTESSWATYHSRGKRQA